ncbi:DUF21 domain-containing protein [Candidatus Poribacteria bacterium]|nr:DUF21 domain-containing protein [Candidatus Poribacteria bacterium]
MDLPFTALGLGVVLVFSVIFSTAEALLNKITKGEVKDIIEEGGPGVEAITSLLQNPRNFSNTIVVAKSLLSVGAVIITFLLVSKIQPEGSITYNLVISAVASAVLLIVFTEMVPKSYVRGRAERSFITALKFLKVFYFILYPVIKFLSFIGNLSVRLLGGKIGNEEEPLTSQEELEALTAVGESEEILEKEEREMIHGIFGLENTVAREIMTPRTDMIYLDVKSDLNHVLSTIVEKGHSRIPVYEDSVDNIVGVLHVKDLLRCWYEDKSDVSLMEMVRPPVLVPETKKIDDLLQEFKDQRTHLAIVIDEYGGTAGLVTIEDVIEEIVGEIQDEYDEEDLLYEQLEDGSYSLDSRMPIDEANELFDIDLPLEGSDSIGGFIVNYLGRVPLAGETFSYDYTNSINSNNGNDNSRKGIQISILESDGRRISRVKISVDELVSNS